MQDRTLLAFAGLLSQRVQLLAGAVRHEKKPQEYHLVVSAVGHTRRMLIMGLQTSLHMHALTLCI